MAVGGCRSGFRPWPHRRCCALADGSFIFLAFLIVALIGVAFGYYTVRGIGIDQHGWSDRDRPFGTRPGKDCTVDVRTRGPGEQRQLAAPPPQHAA